MKKSHLSFPLFLAISLYFLSMICCGIFCHGQAYAGNNAQSGTKKDVQISSKDYENVYNNWVTPGRTSANDDAFWQNGTSAEELLHSKTASGRKILAVPKNSMGPHQASQNSVSNEDSEDTRDITIAGGSIKGDATQLGPSWKAPTDRSIVIDEDLKKEKHDVVGAYGEMLKDDGFEVRMGPEVYIPMGGAETYQGDEKPENPEVGVGMKFLWDF